MSEMERLRADNKRLREAIEPFAAQATRFDGVRHVDGKPLWFDGEPSYLGPFKVGQYRAARAAYEGVKGNERA